MPAAKSLPRKYLTTLDDVQEQLRLMAQKARLALTELETGRAPCRQAPVLLRDIEAGAYRIALELSEIKVANDCDECPSAPSVTSAQIHLYVLAEELDRQATLAREKANNLRYTASSQRIKTQGIEFNDEEESFRLSHRHRKEIQE